MDATRLPSAETDVTSLSLQSTSNFDPLSITESSLQMTKVALIVDNYDVLSLKQERAAPLNTEQMKRITITDSQPDPTPETSTTATFPPISQLRKHLNESDDDLDLSKSNKKTFYESEIATKLIKVEIATENESSTLRSANKIDVWYRIMDYNDKYIDDDTITEEMHISEKILALKKKILGKETGEKVKAYAPKDSEWDEQMRAQLRHFPADEEYKRLALKNELTNGLSLIELPKGMGDSGYFIIIKLPLKTSPTLSTTSSLNFNNVHMHESSTQFNPEKYKVTFPFFDRNAEDYLTMVGRDKVIEEINECVIPLYKQKYRPVIISTSRGMGKTFLLKMIGLQRVKDELKNKLIVDAGSCGRIISFDFAKYLNLIENDEDVELFPCRLMIYFLCLLFDGTKVNEICFQRIKNFKKFAKFDVESDKFRGWLERFTCVKFKNWLKVCLECSTQEMIEEYIRLTNIAFNVEPNSECFTTPPVFLLDEVQCLCRNTNVGSSHTLLSLLITQFTCQCRPILICTGTNDGSILHSTEKSAFIPKVLRLNTLKMREWTLQFWREMTIEMNKTIIEESEKRTCQENDDLIDCLIDASYQVPRLLCLAHQAWFQSVNSEKNKNPIVQCFEFKALEYYAEMKNLFNDNSILSLNDLVRLMLCCGVHWPVPETSTKVPGTNILWSFLIEKSIIFPFTNDCYVFPFSLIWRSLSVDMREKVTKAVQSCVPNLVIEDLFHSFSNVL